MKKLLLGSIVLLAGVSVLLACTDRSASAKQTKALSASASSGDPAAAKPAATPAATPAAAADKVVAYYFHGNRRCPTCIGIQATIQKTILDRFAAELAAGTLVFEEINIQAPENRHFVKTYKLSFSTMVVAAKAGKTDVKWENCKDVWKHAHDKPALAAYTDKHVRAYLALVKRK